MAKARDIVDRMLEADELDFDPERYIKATLTPTDAQHKAVLQQLGLQPVEPGRSKTMWSKDYPGKEGIYHLQVDTEWTESQNVPFWVTMTIEQAKGIEHTVVLTKYLLFSNTFEPVLKQIDRGLTDYGKRTPKHQIRSFIEGVMNDTRNRYGQFTS